MMNKMLDPNQIGKALNNGMPQQANVMAGNSLVHQSKSVQRPAVKSNESQRRQLQITNSNSVSNSA